jgi:glycosyltransferase 2 family protein
VSGLLPRLARLLGDRRLRFGLLVVVLSCCGYGLYTEWPQVVPALGRLRWYAVPLALAAAMTGTSCQMLAWRTILADLGSPIPVRAAGRISFVAQLGKYVPGGVWAVAAQVELGHDYRIPRPRSLAAVLVSLAVTLGTGLAIALTTLPFVSPGLARHYWWVLAIVPLVGVGLCPPVLGRLLDHALALMRSQPLAAWPSWRGLGRALGWNLAGWLLLGSQVWLLVADMGGAHAASALVAVGGYALAFSAGMLLVVVPSGIGARELILALALAPVLLHGAAIAVALTTRGVSTLSDVALGALGGISGRQRRARFVPTSAAAPPPTSAGVGVLSPAASAKEKA